MAGCTKSFTDIPFSFAEKYVRDSKLSANSRIKGQSYAIEGYIHNIKNNEKTVDRLVGQSVGWSAVGRPIGRLVDQSRGLSVVRSVGRSHQSVGLIDRSVD